MTRSFRQLGPIVGIFLVLLAIIAIAVSVLPSETECYGAESCNPTGNPIGGGSGYSRIIPETDPNVKYVVETKDQLFSSLKNAKSGEVVFVKGTAVINMTGERWITIPAGVTLASDRGRGDSSGALITKDDVANASGKEILFITGDGVRITGLRLEGEMAPQNDRSVPNIQYLTGILTHDELEVDNCEIRGWSYAGILVGTESSPGGNAYIHHNYIHHNQAYGLGYGVDLAGGTALIEANIFDYNRHSISGAGLEGERFEARYNRIEGHGNPRLPYFFVHKNPTGEAVAGFSYTIQYNTFDISLTPDKSAVVFGGGLPESGIWIDHNIFYWEDSLSYPPVNHGDESAKSRTHVANNLVGNPPALKNGGEGVISFSSG